MFKKIVAVVIGLLVIVVGAWLIFFNKDSINGEAQSIKENLKSYHIEANMTMYNGEDSRDFSIVVCYQKGEANDFFRVSMLDKAINQEQIILRNENGVYVLTPSLNQVHRFKGDWPLNSPKPYLYHSMLDVFNSSHKLSKLSEGYLVKSKPNYVNAPNWSNQEIKFTTSLKPLELKITNDAGDLQVKLNFTNFDSNPTFGADQFNLDANMNKARENYTAVTGSIEDLPLYPVNANYEATLKEATVVNLEGSTIHVLNYDGDKPFTIIQKMAKNNTELEVSVVNGVVVELFDGIGYYANSTLVFGYNGIEYRISSASMTIDELIGVANGMDIIA